ncbi:MAG: hypothetical protein H0X29_04725 [Parachlamydiaceae bacterium]|nr:hypothetical protein [Parachlamydiaceae bacterium]
MLKISKFMFTCIALMGTFYLVGATATSAPKSTGLPGYTPSKIPPVVYPSKPAAPQVVPSTQAPLSKPVIPAMDKPFGMPGVVGLRDGKWEGTDYLGHVSKNITLDVEVLKNDNTPVNVDISTLKGALTALLKNEGIIPHAELSEGPPLPFLHVLVIIYPVDKDKFVVFTTTRLFEEIQVVRKEFKPAGFWQGITWENQDISLATSEQLVAQVTSSTETLLKAFLERYKLYNKENIDVESAQKIS